jgi:hypothetical protein
MYNFVEDEWGYTTFWFNADQLAWECAVWDMLLCK